MTDQKEQLKPLAPIQVLHLFSGLHDHLLDLLRSLTPEQWQAQTAAPAWKVKDVAAHLLDTDLRRLALQRDDHPPPVPGKKIGSYRDLVEFLDRLNAVWVEAFERISPSILIDLLAYSGPGVEAFLHSLDPKAPSAFPVAWAGQEESPNWFDIAREYTEKWHHQQQIREAVGASPLTDRKWLHPALDTFLRGLPHAYREQHSEPGTTVVVEISGKAGGYWSLRRESQWELWQGRAEPSHAQIQVDQDAAWKLFTKGLSAGEAGIISHGPAALITPFSSFIAVMG